MNVHPKRSRASTVPDDSRAASARLRAHSVAGGRSVRNTRELASLALVLAAALFVRLVFLFTLRSDISVRVPLLDARYYLDLATSLAGGGGWPAGPHFMSPIYPFLLSGLFRIAPPAVETVQWAQLFLGLLTTLCVFAAARRSGRLAAVAAGLLYALCGPAIVYENQVLVESLVAFALAALVLVLGGEGDAGWLAAGAAGLLVGLAGAGRPTYLLLLVPALIVIYRSASRRPQRGRALLASIVGFLLVVAPPTLHNWRQTGRPSFITVSGGLNLYIGNNPWATGIYSSPPGVYLENDLTGARSASRMAGRDLDAEEASRFYARRAWAQVSGHPGWALRLLLRKAGFLAGHREIPQIESVGQIRREHPALRLLAPVGFALLFPLAFLGGIRLRHPRKTWTLALWVLGAGALTHLLFFSTGRYRAALLPCLSLLAGCGISVLPSLIRGMPSSLVRSWPLGAAVVLMLAGPRLDEQKSRAWECHQAGLRFDLMDAPRSAEQMYAKAVTADSTLGEAWHNLAASRAKQGRTADAISAYERALEHLGENPVTLYNLAVLYGRLGMDERALGYFDQAVAADPIDPSIRVDRGVALYRLGRQEEALADWRHVAAMAPGDQTLRRTLSRLAAAGVPLPPDLEGRAGPE